MISCALHDYIEIACLYHIKVRLTLSSDQQLQGTALNTFTNADKKEYLLVKSEHEEIGVELDRIKSMQALTQNPHFQIVDFINPATL